MVRRTSFNKRLIVLLLIFFGLFYAAFFLYSLQAKGKGDVLMTDARRLVPVKVKKVVATKEIEQIKQIIIETKDEDLKIFIAGKQHNQGGQTYYKEAIVLDMTTYNKVINILPEEKLITVQGGATWTDVQEAINPYQLSVKTIQTPNIFTIGDSMSVNVHGRDLRFGPIIESIRSFRLMNAEGRS